MNRGMSVNIVHSKPGFTGLLVQNHWHSPLNSLNPVCLAACNLTDSRAGTGLQGLVTAINKNPEHKTHLLPHSSY